MNAGPVLARTFMNRTVSIIMLLFILTVAGVIVAQIVDNTSLGLIIMIVGCVALFAYTIIAIISLRKKAK